MFEYQLVSSSLSHVTLGPPPHEAWVFQSKVNCYNTISKSGDPSLCSRTEYILSAGKELFPALHCLPSPFQHPAQCPVPLLSQKSLLSSTGRVFIQGPGTYLKQ